MKYHKNRRVNKMGLYMYLEGDIEISSTRDQETNRLRETIETALGLSPSDNINNNSEIRVISVRVALGKWHNAHWIHNWFDEHVEGGVDNSSDPHNVETETLKELLNLCIAIGTYRYNADGTPTSLEELYDYMYNSESVNALSQIPFDPPEHFEADALGKEWKDINDYFDVADQTVEMLRTVLLFEKILNRSQRRYIDFYYQSVLW
jgi:hypothetical protein